LTPNELVLTFGCLVHVCVQFGEDRRRNATVRVSTVGQTHAQTQNDFIICPMLYAIAMGQIKTDVAPRKWFLGVSPENVFIFNKLVRRPRP